MKLFGDFNYIIVVLLMMIGFYAMIARGNLVKKMIGLGILQTSVILFYLSMGKVAGAASPILVQGETQYTNPVPHVLMLTAIVVGVATLSVGLAIIVRLKEAYGTIEEDEIIALNNRPPAPSDEGRGPRVESPPAGGLAPRSSPLAPRPDLA